MTVPKWLAELLRDAYQNKWCNRIGCSTCGALDFRSALARKLCEHAGIAWRPAQSTPHSLLSDLSSEDFVKVTKVALADLSTVTMEDFAQLDQTRRDFDMGMIFSELRGLPATGELASHYGAIYEEERAAAAGRAEATARKHAADRDAAAMRQATREAAAVEHSERRKALCARRLEVIEQLRTMPAEERLIAIAEDRFELSLDAIPFELLKCDSTVIAKVAPSPRRALANRIDQRGGPYRTLRSTLLDGLS